MTRLEVVISVLILIDYSLRERPRVSNILGNQVDEIGVDEPRSLLLKDSVE